MKPEEMITFTKVTLLIGDDAHREYLKLAEEASKHSPDPSTKCGAIVVSDGIVQSQGWNDFPAGPKGRVEHTEERWNNRELKYQFVVHAELNAIIRAGNSCFGATLYSWPPGHGPSCDRCAAHIIAAGITRVVYRKKTEAEEEAFPSRWKEACERGLTMFAEAGVEVVAV
jgi:dCMP deaminase